MQIKTRDLVLAACMLGINGLIWLETRKPQYQQAQEQDYGFDPAFFPRILLTIWTLLTIIIILRAVLVTKGEIEPPVWSRFGFAVALTAVYLFAMDLVGFLFASIPYAAAFMIIFGYRHRVIMPIIAVVFPAITWWVFVYPLHIPLPASPWFVRM